MTGDDVPAELRSALLEHGPAMLDLVLAMTPLRLTWVPGYADYYPEAPGGRACGRSIEPVPFDGRLLGAELGRLNKPYLPVPAGVAVTQADYRWLSLGPRHPRAMLAGAKVAGRLARSRLLGHRMLSLGQALAAGLRAGLAASGVPVWLDTPMTGLVVTDGRVTGVRVVRDGPADGAQGQARGADRDRRIRAQRGDAAPVPASRRSAPTGRPARPGTPATGSWPARNSAPPPG